METFVPTTSTKIIKQLRVQALSSLMFFGEKRYDRFKVRGIPGGKKQRDKISKEDATSLIVALESIMIMSFIDTHRQHDVATIRIPGAYLHTDNDEYNIMILRVILEELVVMVDPNL